MRTAVQLRDTEHLTCQLIHGTPAATIAGGLGPIAIFEPDQLVAYLIDTVVGARVFIFRTLATRDPAAPTVPGVFPSVSLLVATRSRGRAAHLRNLFLYFEKVKLDPASLSDEFYLRVAGVLGGKLDRNNRVLRELLSRELA